MQDELLQAVKDATEEEYDILGELGGSAGRAAYLARERSTGALVAMVLQEDHAPGGGQHFDLAVVRELDESVPAAGHACPFCGAPLDAWPRFCDACGRDVSGAASDEAVPGVSRGVLLDEVRSATEGEYEILGFMERADGGGVVYFGRELSTARLAGLSLQRDDAAAGNDFTLVTSWQEPHAARDAPEPPHDEVRVETEDPADSSARGAYPGGGALEEAPRQAPYAASPGHPSHSAAARNPRRDGSDRRRLLVLAGVGVGAVAAAWLLIALLNGPDERDDSLALADSAPVQQDPISPESQLPVPDQALPGSGSPRGDAPDERSPRSRREGNEASEAPPAVPPPSSTPQPEARGAASVEGAIQRYAQALQSRDEARIRAAYPEITDRELARWRDHLGAGGPVSYTLQTEPEVDGDAAEIIFDLTLRASDGSPRPMTFRGLLAWENGGWRLREARSLGGF